MRRYSLFVLMFLCAISCAQGQQIQLGWVKAVNGTNTMGFHTCVDKSGNVFVSGSFRGTADFDPGPNTANLTSTGGPLDDDKFILKLDSTGKFVWVRQVPGPKSSIVNIAVDAAGNLYAAGYFRDTVDIDPGTGVQTLISKGFNDAVVIKLNSAGNLQWARQIGGAGYETFNALAVDATGNVFLTGGFSTTTDFDPGSGVYNLTSLGAGDCFVLKLSTSGGFQWAKSFGGSDDGQGSSIAVDNSANVYLFGDFKGTVDFDPGPGLASFSDPLGGHFIVKLRDTGIYTWARTFPMFMDVSSGGGCVNGIEMGWEGFAVSAKGNVYLSSHFNGVKDFDPDPAVSYQLSSGGCSAFVLKLNTVGNFQWAKNISGTKGARSFGLVTDNLDNVYYGGTLKDTVDFDPGVGVYKLGGTEDIFVSKLDSSGSFLWAYNARETTAPFGYYDVCSGVAMGSGGQVYAVGTMSAPALDFDHTNGSIILNNTGNNTFILKLNQAIVSSRVAPKSVLEQESIALYPNPAAGLLNVVCNENFKPTTLRVYSLTGLLIEEKQWATGTLYKLDISSYSNGIYLCTLTNAEGQMQRDLFEKL